MNDDEQEGRLLEQLIERLEDDDGEEDPEESYETVAAVRLAILNAVAPALKKGATAQEVAEMCESLLLWVMSDAPGE